MSTVYIELPDPKILVPREDIFLRFGICMRIYIGEYIIFNICEVIFQSLIFRYI